MLGRSDRYYIKQYEQETNFVAHLLLDGSESMRYGSGAVSKLDYAKVMASCLAYLILLQRDAAAVTVFDDKPREHIPRTDSLAKIHTICAVLSAFNPTQPTAISETLDDLARKTRRRGIVVLMSDLLDDEDKLIRGIQHLRFVGHEVIVFQVLDPHEVSFPFQGNVEFIGLEAQGRLLTRPSEIRKSYLEEFGAFLDRIRLACERCGATHIRITTDKPWAEVLTAYLATRQHRYG